MTWNQNGATGAWNSNRSTWMSQLPDELGLQNLTIPGTHDSAALEGYLGSNWFEVHMSDTQQWRIDQQLENGIRFLDLRVKILFNHRGLGMYHAGDIIRDPYGSMYDQLYLKTVLQKCVDFLKANPREVIVVSLKCEGDTSYEGWTVEDWFRQIANEVAADNPPGTWNDWWKYPADVDLTLGDARGKLVLWRRFPREGKDTTLDYTKPFGLNLTPMNVKYDNTTGADWWTPTGGYTFVQDHYTKTTVAEKFDAWQKGAARAWVSRKDPTTSGDTNRQFINFTSIGAGRYPSTYAKVMNPALSIWLDALLTGKASNGVQVGGTSARSGLGVIPMDFPLQSNVDMLIRANFEPTWSLDDTPAGKAYLDAILQRILLLQP